MCHQDDGIRYSSHLTAFAFLKGISIVCRKSSGHSPVLYVSWQSWISSFNAISSRLFNISAGMLSIPSALLFFIFLMAANISSLMNDRGGSCEDVLWPPFQWLCTW